MIRRKMSRADRKLLKKAGFGREYKEMGALACALEEAKHGYRESGYEQQADSCFGKRTRRRVRRERWNRQVRVMRRFCQLGAIYLGCLAVTVVLWHYLLEFVGWLCRD